MAVNKKTKKSKSAKSTTDVKDTKREALMKKYGSENIVYGLSSDSNVKRITTGIIGIDHIFGINQDGTGGAPMGRIIEIYGPESSGKTALSLSILGNAQKMNQRCGVIDMEHTLTHERCVALGIDPEKLLHMKPEDGEDALNLTKDLIAQDMIDFLVIDSVAALVSKAELLGDIGKHNVGTQAKMMSQAMRQLCKMVADKGVTIIFINQLRMKIGVMFGSPETTPGGESLKFYASIRLDIRRSAKITDGDTIIGNEVKIKAPKNKTAPAHRDGVFKFYFADGFSQEDDLITLAIKFGIFSKSGAWISYQGENIAQGVAKCITYLKENPKFKSELDLLVRQEVAESLNPKKHEEVVAEEVAPEVQKEEESVSKKKTSLKNKVNPKDSEEPKEEELESA